MEQFNLFLLCEIELDGLPLLGWDEINNFHSGIKKDLSFLWRKQTLEAAGASPKATSELNPCSAKKR